MFRIRTVATFTVVVVVLTVAVMLGVTIPVSKRVRAGVDVQLDRAAKLCERGQQLDGAEVADIVDKLATDRLVVEALLQKEVSNQRVKAFSTVETYADRLREWGRRADFVAVLDRVGKVVARDLDPKHMVGEDLKKKFPSVAKALEGRATKDIWNFNGNMYKAGVAAVKAPKSGEVLGALVVAYTVRSQEAKSDAEQFGTEVAYFMGDRFHASSFVAAGTETEDGKWKEDVELSQTLADQLFGAGEAVKQAISTQRTSEIVEVEAFGDVYRAKAGPLPGNSTNKNSGYVVIASLTDALNPVGTIRLGVILFGLATLFLVLGSGVVVERHFLRGLDRIEKGTNEVITGNMDFSFEAEGEEYEGLANGLNTMLARLLGRPEPGDEDEGAAGPSGGDIIKIGVPQGTPQEVRALSQEPEEAYRQRVYKEYVTARQSLGESVEGLTPDGFGQKLVANEAMIKAKHKCSAVRFVVQQAGGSVSLRPVPIP